MIFNSSIHAYINISRIILFISLVRVHNKNLITQGTRRYTTVHVTPQKYPKIFIIKFIINFGYNWANLGIFLGIVRLIK